MKPLRITLAIVFCILSAVPNFSQSKARTLVKSFNVSEVETVDLNIDGEVKIKNWTKDFMRIEMEVSLENGTDRLLKNMVVANRFYLASETQNSNMTIFVPGLKRDITIGGQVIKEKISCSISIPERILTKVSEKETLSMSSPEEK